VKAKSAKPNQVPRRGKPESAPARATFPKRTEKPGAAGLANEARPGLGTRVDDANSAERAARPPQDAKSRAKPRATKLGYEKPRPAPREQPPNSMAHELERSTGMSGQSAGV